MRRRLLMHGPPCSMLLFLLVDTSLLSLLLPINYSPVANSFALTTTTTTNQNDNEAGVRANSSQAAAPSIAFNTFHLRGGIGSLVTSILNPSNILHKDLQQYVFSSTTDKYVVVGNWTMDVRDGAMEYFRAVFIMGLINGTQMHVYDIGNLRNVVIVPPTPGITEGVPNQKIPTEITISQADNYSLSLFGYVDVLENDKVRWQNVPVTIDIIDGNVISIFLEPSNTDNHFKGVPIYGVVVWILDDNYLPLRPSSFAYHQVNANESEK